MLVKKNNSPLIVAELSANHNNSLVVAKKIISILSTSGIWAVKFQAFKPENMAPNVKSNRFKIKDKKSLWKGQSFYN